MKKKKATIHDIARELNVTASTVSRALKDHPRISDSTKASVLKMAKKLDYQPNSIAAALRSGKSNIIGVIVPTTNRNFFASIIRGIEEVVNKSGYNIIICQSNDSLEKEKENIRALLEAQVDGILASYAKETTNFGHYQEIINRGVPLILFDRLHESLNVGSVVIDDYLGAYKATEHLIKQGCKRIIHFAGPKNVSIYNDRRQGYEGALRKYDIPVEKNLIIENNLKLEAGRELGHRILEMKKRPDGIFSASDYSAMGAMEVLKKGGVKIPDEIAIVGFSNEPFTSFVEPGLSTVDQQSNQMGNFSARLFLDYAHGNIHLDAPPKTVLSPKLVVRGSSLKKEESSIE